ncbi:MAG TPA: HlyD family secretion protein [Pseudolabrys sp.]|nr:HlyD family secretion protein [Pseudolabrys sp.]
MRISTFVERAVRNRVVRVSLATLLLAASAWAFGPYVGSRVGSSAFVNAELTRVTSPFAGRLTTDLPRRGEFIAQARTVTLVEALAPDQRHLFDLRQQYTVANERAQLTRAQLDEIKSVDHGLGDRAEAYKTGVVNRISREIEEASAENAGCLAEVEQRREIGSRMEQLTKLGTASQIRSAEALAVQEATNTRCEVALARVKRLKVELESAERGVFLRDGANDVPYSQQQRDRLMLRRQELETELLNETSKAHQLAAAITEESERLTRSNSFKLPLPAGNVVWTTGASPGSTVVEGQFVMDLADCGHRFVAVELPERAFEKIKAGDRASIRLVGSDAWVEGYVRQERGSAARVDDRLLAATVAKPSSGSISVEVEIPAEAWSEDRHGNFCDIGRLAEVRFPRHGISFSSMARYLLGVRPAAATAASN